MFAFLAQAAEKLPPQRLSRNMIHRGHCGDGGNDAGSDKVKGSQFRYFDFEGRIPERHPLRKVRAEPMTGPTHRNRNAEVDFRGERRSNATYASTTDPEAQLFKKSSGAGAVLCFGLMENRSGLIVQADLPRADGHAKSQRCRKKMEEPFGWVKTVGGMAQTLYRGIERVRARFILVMAACNLARLPKLLAA